MRKQQQIWLEEHTQKATLPRMANVEPASGVVRFIEYLREKGVTLEGTAVDIGAGKGRNSVYLAELGLRVEALEYIKPAISAAKALAEAHGVAELIRFREVEIDRAWDYKDNYFEIAVDSFSSIDIETKQGREIYRDELLRTLKPGGYAIVTACSAADEWERELIAKHPGPEPNSTIWPQNGKFQKDYDEEEIREFYKAFEIAELRTISKQTFKLGRDGTATNLWGVLRKPD